MRPAAPTAAFQTQYFRVRFSISLFAELIFSDTADRTDKIIRKIFKCRSRSNSVIRIADLRIIFPAAYITYILIHSISSCSASYAPLGASHLSCMQIISYPHYEAERLRFQENFILYPHKKAAEQNAADHLSSQKNRQHKAQLCQRINSLLFPIGLCVPSVQMPCKPDHASDSCDTQNPEQKSRHTRHAFPDRCC